jgi:glycine C-acetyltransferase
MRERFFESVALALGDIEAQGLTKPERVIHSSQDAWVRVWTGEGEPERRVLNLCANNYLGLAACPRVAEGAIEAIRSWGAGVASVRFICGTLGIHKALEAAIADYLGFEDAILFAAAFDANGGVFEPLLGESDAIVSDSLNHASIIDGVRLSKARRYRFANGNMAELAERLEEARTQGAQTILIATDGVFSMDGLLANLPEICRLADQFGALVMVDDCHATGVLGPQGRGVAAVQGAEGRIDILTGTLGKALGGGMGGFIAARREVVELLRQRARPYLFSNALAPAVCGGALAAIEIARGAEGDDRRRRLARNAARFRAGMDAAGFRLTPGDHPIIPVLLGEARLAQEMAARLFDEGVYVTGFSFPVVPRGQARIRTQMSAGHSEEDIDFALQAFGRVGRSLGVIA